MNYRMLSVVCAVLFSVGSLAGCGSGGSAPAEASGSAPVAGEGPVVAPPEGNDDKTQPPGLGSAALAWDAPTTNVDGTSLGDLSGYKVHYGTSPGNYTSTLSVGRVSNFLIKGLAPGTYYFAVTAFNSAGVESDYSNEIARQIL